MLAVTRPSHLPQAVYGPSDSIHDRFTENTHPGLDASMRGAVDRRRPLRGLGYLGQALRASFQTPFTIWAGGVLQLVEIETAP